MSRLLVHRTTSFNTIRSISLLLVVFISSISFHSCTPSIFYDAEAYNACQELKTEALNVMGMATNSFSDHKDDVERLTDRIDAHIDYERNRGEKNTKIVEMWNLLMDPSSNLLGGFLQRWEDRGKLSNGFVTEAKNIVSNNFDKILNLENGRKRQSLGN